MKETDLYPPVKAFLQAQGYDVKGEVKGCDVVAIRGEEPPVIVELKIGLSVQLLVQGVARLSITDQVYVATPARKSKGRGTYRDILTLCRRLGLGYLTINADGKVTAHLDPMPYQPRKSKIKQARLLKEFQARSGDPATGGSVRQITMTAYRQDALRCVGWLGDNGPGRGRDVASGTGVSRATALMRDNHYGWFEKISKGVYGLSAEGAGVAISEKSRIKEYLSDVPGSPPHQDASES